MATDIKKHLAGLEEAKRRQIDAARRGLDIAGEHVIGDAQQIVPVLTGALQASGTTTPAEVDGTKIKKVIGFNTNYAAAVHERLDAHHPVGQAKYLETAVRNNAKKVSEFVANEIRKVS